MAILKLPISVADSTCTLKIRKISYWIPIGHRDIIIKKYMRK